MDKLLQGLLSFPPHPPPSQPLSDSEYDRQIQAQVKLLNSTPASQLVKPIGDSGNILSVLDPAINSLPYLYTLLAHLNDKSQSNTGPATPLWLAIERFVTSFNPIQVRYAGAPWRQLVDELLSIASVSADHALTSHALGLVQQAMLRLDPGTSTFTSTHLDLVKVCLKRRVHSGCLQVLDNEVYHFPSDSDSKYDPPPCAKHLNSSAFITTTSGFSGRLTYRDHLQYFLLAAMVYISGRSWSRALDKLELALCAPVSGNTVSMIQVEAYKKWILVSVLSHGRPASMPRSVSTHVAKYLASLAKPYAVFADAFKDGTPAKLRAEFQYAAENNVWQRDGNLGLAKLVVGAHRRIAVLNFSKIYSSIPVSTLSEMMSNMASSNPEPPSAIEADIRHLISSQRINASIVKGKDGSDIVKFLSPTGEVLESDVEQMKQLQLSVARVNALTGHVKDAQSRLELSKEYIEGYKKRIKPAQNAVDTLPGAGDIQVPKMGSNLSDDMLAEY